MYRRLQHALDALPGDHPALPLVREAVALAHPALPIIGEPHCNVAQPEPHRCAVVPLLGLVRPVISPSRAEGISPGAGLRGLL